MERHTANSGNAAYSEAILNRPETLVWRGQEGEPAGCEKCRRAREESRFIYLIVDILLWVFFSSCAYKLLKQLPKQLA